METSEESPTCFLLWEDW